MNRSRREADDSIVQLEEAKRETTRVKLDSDDMLDEVIEEVKLNIARFLMK
jgi:hypothetical protein